MVKRYECIRDTHRMGDDGPWVTYEDHAEEIARLRAELGPYSFRKNQYTIDVFLTLHDGYVSFRFGTRSGSEPCDTTNPTAALAKAFQHCIELITEPHEIIVVHQEDLREKE